MAENFTEIYNHAVTILNSKLPDYLTYHDTYHTLYVFEKAIYLAGKERVSAPDLRLLKIAALFHDTGFIHGPNEHEEKSCAMAKNELKKFNASEKDIAIICNLIRATKIPQHPKTALEMILADADLEYLATNKFKIQGDKLFKEMKHFNPKLKAEDWKAIQIDFFKDHRYHTSFCKQYKEHRKLKNLEKLINNQL